MEGRVGNAGKSKWTILAVFALLICALALSACGGGGTSSSTEAETATTSESTGEEPAEETAESTEGESEESVAEGEPLVTLTYTDVNTEGAQYKNIEETARVYQEWINSHGGIGGRPLEAKFCDARGTPTGAAACAREAVADNAIATVGSYTITGDAVTPILEKAGIAQFGNCCAIAPSEFTSPISYPLGSQPVWSAGLLSRAVHDGCKKINAVVVEGAEAFDPLLENAAKAEGVEIGKFVTAPGTAQDYSPQVAEATAGGAECLLMILNETLFIAWMPAFTQSGSEARLYGPQGNFNENAVKGFESQVEGDIVAGIYPDISLPQWTPFREALAKYEADMTQDYNSLGGLGTWAAYEAFKQVVETMSGPINNETFLKTVATAKINLPGMLPPENLAKPWGKDGGPPEFARLNNRCAVYSEFKEGKLVPASTQFEDVSELAGGTKPMNCGPPFATE
jgi:ABC-type branched-subunit amino acid transport system substrate-binding protein